MREFLRWWLGNLGSLLPAALRGRHSAHKHVYRLTLTADQAILRIGEQDYQIPIDPEDTSDLISPPSLEGGLLELELVPGQFLVRRLKLPVAAKDHLKEAIGYQLPRLVPFSPSKMRFAFGIDKKASDKTDLWIWVVVVPRERLDKVLRWQGIDPEAWVLEVKDQPAPGEPLLIPWRLSDRAGRRKVGRRLLAVGLIVLWAAPLGLHIYHQYAQRHWLEEQLAERRPLVAETRRLIGELENAAHRVEWLNEKKRRTASALEVLEVLSQKVPSDSWLQSFEYKSGHIVLQGYSPAPGRLIQRLEELPMLENVQFASAVVSDPRQGGSRFKIRADLVNATAGESQ